MVGRSGGISQRRVAFVQLWVQLLLLLCGGGTKVFAGLVRGGEGATMDRTDSARHLEDVGSITRLDLINAITDKSITTLFNNQVIVVSSIPGMSSPNFNIEAKTTGDVDSVVFALNGVNVQTDNSAAWAFCSHSGSNFSPCPSLIGTVTVSATPYSSKNGGGTKGATVSVTFSIILNAPTAPTQPTKSPTKSPVVPLPPPVRSPTKAPVKAPTKAPVKAPTKAPAKAPTKAPVKAPTKAPVKAPTKAPVKAPTKSPAVATAPTIPTVSPVLINCGSSSSYTDSQNRVWLADAFFDADSGVYSTSSAIANTVEDTLYQTERTGATIAYSIPRPPGTYAVTLHFAEI
jgi:Malectin domain